MMMLHYVRYWWKLWRLKSAARRVGYSRVNTKLFTLGNRIHPFDYDSFFSIVKYLNPKFRHEGDLLYIELPDFNLNLSITSGTDFSIIDEIFRKSCYHFNHSEPMIIWDIGMNAGIASLYFASFPQVKAVESYELVPEIYEQALKNFNLNRTLSKKIQAHPFGIGKGNSKITIEYNPQHTGSSTYRFTTGKTVQEHEYPTECEVKDAREICHELLKKYPHINKMAKIDCEGAEGEILESLGDLLRKFTILIIEWHGKENKELVEAKLTEHGFIYFSQNRQLPIGRNWVEVIYAVNNSG